MTTASWDAPIGACNDREVLGPWWTVRGLDGVAAVTVGTLSLLSGILMATALFPDVDVVSVAEYLGPDKSTWRMPPLSLLGLVKWSPGIGWA